MDWSPQQGTEGPVVIHPGGIDGHTGHHYDPRNIKDDDSTSDAAIYGNLLICGFRRLVFGGIV